MLEIKRFRVDTLKLSTESMPVAEADGTTCYEVDTGKFYIYYKGEWYEQGAEETSVDDSEVTEESNAKNIEEPIEITKEVVEPIIEEPVEK